MKTSRRDFIKLAGLTGIGIGTGFQQVSANRSTDTTPYRMSHNQKFNMSGYAAPKLETVRIGLIGVGSRGFGALRRHIRIEGVKITALADLDPGRVNRAREFVREYGHDPVLYSGGEDEWKKLCESDDVDLVYICTPWHLHTPNAIYAMENEKHAATEIPAAQTLDDCWRLVETSEKTRRHCIMLENVCYDFFEMMTLNMARQGFFGELIHGEGAYIHDLMQMNFSKTSYANMWRLEENSKRNGSLYPMHGLGPICQLMNINYGDRLDYLVSVSSNDFMMGNKAKELAEGDDFYLQYAERNYRGNINTTVIRTGMGRSIMVQHDVSSPRPYSRIHLISGTKAIAQKYPLPARIATNHRGWLSEEEFKSLEQKFTPEITRKVGQMARQVGGHGGMDTLMDWRIVDCLRNGLPLDMNVYDAALWSSVIPLSERSVAHRSKPVDIPDFTGGSWISNKPRMDINLEKGGLTKLI